MLLSRIPQGTDQDIVDTNKLLRRAKLSQHRKTRIHAFRKRRHHRQHGRMQQMDIDQVVALQRACLLDGRTLGC